MRPFLPAPHVLAAAIAFLGPLTVWAQPRVSPSGVNINAQGATTAVLTYSGISGSMGEGLFCGEVVPATPASGLRCAPGTIFGQVPARYARTSGSFGSVSDVITVPASVARRAYQAAAAGGPGVFYFVRRFHSEGIIESFVAVTLRLTRGGARTPFGVTDVKLQFLTEDPVLYVATGDAPSDIEAIVRYNGSGRLSGRWEIVYPGEAIPTERERATEFPSVDDVEFPNRRFTQLSRFNVFLPPTGQAVIPGPDPSRLPSATDGVYHVVMRIESVFDAESPVAGQTVIGVDGPVVEGTGRLAGGAAPFPLPVLRYIVGSGANGAGMAQRAGEIRLRRPAPGSELPVDALRFVWTSASRAVQYRVEVEREDGARVLGAVVSANNRVYSAPPWFSARAPRGPLRWRVLALDRQGRTITRSEWARFRLLPSASR